MIVPRMPNRSPLLKIFRAGTHTTADGREITFSDTDLAAAVAAYDPAVHEAPLVIGHPKDNAPAWGWVETLGATDGVMVAGPRQVDPEFAELVKAGRFKKISASFYTPDSKLNPKPGAYYLRHVGFLGAQPPSLKGLGDAQFSGRAEDGDVVEFSSAWREAGFWRGLRDWLLAKFGEEDADRVVPSWAVSDLERAAVAEEISEWGSEGAAPAFTEQKKPETPAEDPEMASFAEREKAMKERLAALDEKVKAITEREVKVARVEVESFCEQLVKEGKVLPRDREGLVELLAATPATELEFAEGDAAAKVKAPANTWLRGFLSRLPVQVDFSERAPAGDVPKDNPVELAEAARQYQAEQEKLGNKVRTSDAVRVVAGR